MSAKPTTDRVAEREKRRRCRCIHFNGTQNEKCEVGIRYKDVELPNPDEDAFPRHSLPCWTDDETFNTAKLDCASRVLPTEEQLAEEDRRTQKAIENIGRARKAIMAFVTEQAALKRDIAGRIPCPNCEGGTLHFRRAGAYNGHVHARCTTAGCCGWME